MASRPKVWTQLMSDTSTISQHNALSHFRGENRYNCAQAIFQAFASQAEINEACLRQYHRHGSGRAPGGECGALFAAKAMISDETKREALATRFIEAAGSDRCRDIRRGKSFSCAQCVQKAADELAGYLANGNQLMRPKDCRA